MKLEDGGGGFTEDGGFSGIVETEDEDTSFFVPKYGGKQLREHDSHLLPELLLGSDHTI